jgi:hypothetical protein
MGAPERDIAQAKDFIAPPGYQRRRPEATLLYRLVAEHCPRFLDRRASEGRLPGREAGRVQLLSAAGDYLQLLVRRRWRPSLTDALGGG